MLPAQYQAFYDQLTAHIDPARLHEGLKRLANVIRQAQAAQAA
jgi:hypothetical protein